MNRNTNVRRPVRPLVPVRASQEPEDSMEQPSPPDDRLPRLQSSEDSFDPEDSGSSHINLAADSPAEEDTSNGLGSTRIMPDLDKAAVADAAKVGKGPPPAPEGDDDQIREL